MWSGKDNGDQDGLRAEEPHPIPNDDGASRSSRRSHQPSRRSEEPTERTRLLDRPRPPPNSDGYLDPDDPAVCSPVFIQSVYLTIPGIAIQPLDGSRYALPDHPLPRHHLLVVGTIAGIHLRLPSWPTHPRIRFLRLCLHMSNPRQSPRRNHLLRYPCQRSAHHNSHHRRTFGYRHDPYPSRTTHQARGRLGWYCKCHLGFRHGCLVHFD